MDAEQAIELVADWIRYRGLDYPTDGLTADRFEAGWSVYAPVEIDESDPMAFLDMPVGRSVFLIGDSGRIKEVTSSTPPRQAEEEFVAEERAAPAEFMAEFKRGFMEAESQGPPVASSFTIVEPSERRSVHEQMVAARRSADEEMTAAEAARLITPIVQQLAQLGPIEWDRFTAEFAFTVSAEVAQLWFLSGDRSNFVPVPESIAALVRQQRQVAAEMPAGPWWRLLLTVIRQGTAAETRTAYDYGDEPFPEDQLLPAEHYRNDLEAYPRPEVPVWLAEYIAGKAVRGRTPH